MPLIFNSPPNWPKKPKNWRPKPDWRPDPSWGPAPDGWQFWIPEESLSAKNTAELPSTDLFATPKTATRTTSNNGSRPSKSGLRSGSKPTKLTIALYAGAAALLGGTALQVSQHIEANEDPTPNQPASEGALNAPGHRGRFDREELYQNSADKEEARAQVIAERFTPALQNPLSGLSTLQNYSDSLRRQSMQSPSLGIEETFVGGESLLANAQNSRQDASSTLYERVIRSPRSTPSGSSTEQPDTGTTSHGYSTENAQTESTPRGTASSEKPTGGLSSGSQDKATQSPRSAHKPQGNPAPSTTGEISSTVPTEASSAGPGTQSIPPAFEDSGPVRLNNPLPDPSLPDVPTDTATSTPIPEVVAPTDPAPGEVAVSPAPADEVLTPTELPMAEPVPTQ